MVAKLLSPCLSVELTLLTSVYYSHLMKPLALWTWPNTSVIRTHNLSSLCLCVYACTVVCKCLNRSPRHLLVQTSWTPGFYSRPGFYQYVQVTALFTSLIRWRRRVEITTQRTGNSVTGIGGRLVCKPRLWLLFKAWPLFKAQLLLVQCVWTHGLYSRIYGTFSTTTVVIFDKYG